MDNNNNDNNPNKPTNTTDGAAVAATSSVSDQEALEALLASAKAKEEQKQQLKSPPTQNDSKKPRRDGGRGGGRRDDRGGRGGDHHNRNQKNGPDYSYYGNNARNSNDGDGEGKATNSGEVGADEEETTKEKEKPNFGLSGALAQEEVGELKFREPPEARAPNTQWRFYVFKNDEAIETLHISKQSAYLFGRNKELADIPLLHPSASGQHAVLQYRALPGKEDGRLRCKPYLMDLESTNGSFINGVQIDPARYYELRKGDVLKFGASTREYVLLTENTTAIK